MKQSKPAPEGYHYMPDGTLMKNHDMKHKHSKDNYTPLFIIIGLIALTSIVSLIPSIAELSATGIFNTWMSKFMAGFFLVFGGFKLIDIKGFRDGYATYDILAKKIPTYGLIYPFIEVLLGFGYILMPDNIFLNIFTAVLLGFSSIGVIQSLMKNSPIKCACLGTALNIPLSKITVIEDIGMAVMAVLMIFL